MKPWWFRKLPPITQRPYIICATFIHDKYPLHHLQNFSIIIFLVIRKPSPKLPIKKFIIPQTFTKNSPPSIPQITPNRATIFYKRNPNISTEHEFTLSKLNKERNRANFKQLESNFSILEIRQACNS